MADHDKRKQSDDVTRNIRRPGGPPADRRGELGPGSRVALYVSAAVSTDRVVSAAGGAARENALRAFVAARGWQVAKLYADAGENRPGFASMLHDASCGCFDAIIAAERPADSELEQVLAGLGVHLVALSEDGEPEDGEPALDDAEAIEQVNAILEARLEVMLERAPQRLADFGPVTRREVAQALEYLERLGEANPEIGGKLAAIAERVFRLCVERELLRAEAAHGS